MTKPTKEAEKAEGVELEPDAWERFETAVDRAVKGGPKHKSGRVVDNTPKKAADQ